MGIKCPIGKFELEIEDWVLKKMGKNIGYFLTGLRVFLVCIASLLEQRQVLTNELFAMAKTDQQLDF